MIQPRSAHTHRLSISSASSSQPSSFIPHPFFLVLALTLATHAFAASPTEGTSSALSPTKPAAIAIAPPVGFVQIDIPANSDAVVSTPFNPTESSIGSVLAGQLTASTNLATADRVLLWDAVNSRYRVAAKLLFPNSASTEGQWYTIESDESGAEKVVGPVEDDFRIAPGAGFVLCNRQDRAQTVRIAGEVIIQVVQSMPIPAGLSLLSYPFTSAGDVSDPQRSTSPTNTLPMGRSAWAGTETATVLNEPRPYPNPFSSSNFPVRIADIICDPDKTTLDIVVADRSVQAVDILILDLAPTTVVTNWTGWRIAAAVDTAGKSEFAWSDDLSASASSFKGVRLYLATRADEASDLDNDGTPDPRQSFLRQEGSPSEQKTPPAAADPAAGDRTLAASGPVLTAAPPAAANPIPALRSSTAIVFVDIRHGDDRLPGTSRVIGASDGPKKTIASGQAALKSGGTMVIRDGTYNEDLNISGKPIHVTVEGKVTLRNVSK